MRIDSLGIPHSSTGVLKVHVDNTASVADATVDASITALQASMDTKLDHRSTDLDTLNTTMGTIDVNVGDVEVNVQDVEDLLATTNSSLPPRSAEEITGPPHRQGAVDGCGTPGPMGRQSFVRERFVL